MAYPTVSAPYGLKPVNLIGGQVFAGSTRNLPIAYGYNTSIFYGDLVYQTGGYIGRTTLTSNSFASGKIPVGVFLGVSYTNPITKQKTFAQYWPAGTLAGDAVAIVTDDPDTIFKIAVVSSGTTIASASTPVIGYNLQLVDNTGNTNTGNSAIAALGLTASPATTSTFPLRVIGLATDTAYSYAGIGSSSTSSVTLTTGVSGPVLAGAEVGYVPTGGNGLLIPTGTFVTGAVASGATTGITLNTTPSIPNAGAPITAIPTGATVSFTNYPEVLVKINFGQHMYYAATANA
jgi:hypothetical protein